MNDQHRASDGSRKHPLPLQKEWPEEAGSVLLGESPPGLSKSLTVIRYSLVHILGAGLCGGA